MAAPDTLRYLKFDFASHKDALLQRVRARWPRAWNDFLANSFGIVLVDLVAWSTATTAYLINKLAGENFVGTMTLRESAVRLGANFGYQLAGPTPAVVSCEATLQSAQSAQVTIPQGTLLRTADSTAQPFEVAQDYVILAGALTPVQVILEISPALAGANTLAALVSVTNGSVDADLTNSAIDLTQYVAPGQVFQRTGDTAQYGITSIESAPNAVSNNRLVLATPWAGTTGLVTASILDLRIALVQGQTVTDNFAAPTAPSPNYGVLLSQTPVINGSVTVTVNTVSWTQVNSLAGSASTDEVFVVQTYTNGQTGVNFGDGVFGMLMPTDANIVVNYRVGGGASGNIALNSISTSITGLITSTNSPTTVTITNLTSSGQGGQDAETLEQARVNIPYFVRTNDRAVTLDDYQTMAQQFSSAQYGSVAYARSTIRTENALLEGNIVSIYAWTTGTGGGLVPLSPQLNLALTTYLQTKAVGTDFVQILNGDAVPVPISMRFETLSGFDVNDTQLLILAEINTIITALRPGQPVIFSDLVSTLNAVDGVANVTMATPLSNLIPASTIQLFTVPQPGYVYPLARNGVGSPVASAVDGTNISLYTAQLPVFPIQAWSVELFLGSNQLTILPDLVPGSAMILGANISQNLTQDANDNYLYRSTINLLTGQVSLWLVGAPGDLTMELNTIAGYSAIRLVNIYIGYTGDNSETTRQAVRAAVQAWGDGLPIGGTIYAQQVAGITSSLSNITALVGAVNGVTAVSRVALDSPSNTAFSLTVLDFEQIEIANVFINNEIM